MKDALICHGGATFTYTKTLENFTLCTPKVVKIQTANGATLMMTSAPHRMAPKACSYAEFKEFQTQLNGQREWKSLKDDFRNACETPIVYDWDSNIQKLSKSNHRNRE